MDLRCFISIELPESLKKDIGARTEGLRATGADVKWVSSENLHLTLKFMGRTPEELVPDIKEELIKAVTPLRRFHIRLSGAGVFPDRKRPRVIWIGVPDSETLVMLQEDIERSMSDLGFETEQKQYRPHLTIGRVKSQRGKDELLKELDLLKDTAFNGVEVGSVSVMKSELRPTGARYFKLFDIPLGGNGPRQ